MLKGQSFIADADGWFMFDARYMRYRKAVADKILEIQTNNTTNK